jgi:hypothetical protein
MVLVLNVPTLFYYSLETHYILDQTKPPSQGESAEERKRRLLHFQLLNWLVLITRAVEDPTNTKQVKAFLDVALVSVKLLSIGVPKPDPRLHMLSVQSNMGGQLVERQSYGVVVGNDARVVSRREVQEREDEARRRFEASVASRLKE